MATEFSCPGCGGTLRVRDGIVGRTVRCGGCLATFRVPEPRPAEPSRPTRPAEPPDPAPPPDEPEESPAPARGLRFWLMVTAGALVAGACGCCGLAAVLLPGPEWRNHESQKGGFKVLLPAAPRDDMAKQIRAQGGQAVEGTTLWSRGENFSVSYRDVPPARQRPKGMTDDRFLDDLVKAVTTEPSVRSVGPVTPVEVSGFPGREFEMQSKNNGTVAGRVVLADTRVYILLAGGRFSRPGGENARKFLESFEITDPKLLAVAKQRAQEKAAAQKDGD